MSFRLRCSKLLFQIGIHHCFFWFGVQSRYFILAFRGIVSFWHSEPLITSQLDVQSHHSFVVYDTQSHHVTLSARRSEPLLRLAFRATIVSQFRHSELHSQFMAFRAIIVTSQFRYSELSSLPRLGFRVAFSILAFRAIIVAFPGFGIQRHHHIFIRRLEPSLSLLSVGVQSHPHHIFSFGF